MEKTKSDYEKEYKKREKTIKRLTKKGLTIKEIAKKMLLSESTLRRDIKRFGLDINSKRQGFNLIGDKVLEDYKNGATTAEIAHKYGRSEMSVIEFIQYGKNNNFKTDRHTEFSSKRLKLCSALYKIELDKTKKKIQIGNKLIYKGKEYIVIAKYKRFVDLQGERYGTTALYDDLIKRDNNGCVAYG